MFWCGTFSLIKLQNKVGAFCVQCSCKHSLMQTRSLIVPRSWSIDIIISFKENGGYVLFSLKNWPQFWWKHTLTRFYNNYFIFSCLNTDCSSFHQQIFQKLITWKKQLSYRALHSVPPIFCHIVLYGTLT